jgi:hypothetical protein
LAKHSQALAISGNPAHCGFGFSCALIDLRMIPIQSPHAPVASHQGIDHAKAVVNVAANCPVIASR